MKKVTLQEIADEIGVSRITISKVINNRPGVSESTRKRIVNALIEHNYKGISRYADSVSTNSEVKQTIGVISISPDFSKFWLEIIQAISGELNFYSQEVVFFFLARNKQGHYELPQGVDSARLNGLVVINVYDKALIKKIRQADIPTVYFDCPPSILEESLPGDVVYVESYNSFKKITGTLLDRGYKDIAYIGDIHYAQTMTERYKGFVDAHDARGLEVDPDLCFIDGPTHLFYDQEEVDQLVKGIKRVPDAIVCGNDDIAKRVIKALKDQNRFLENELVVTGYDHLDDSDLSKSLYATVEVDRKALGLRLVRQILYRIKTEDEAFEQIYIEPELIIQGNLLSAGKEIAAK